MTCSHKLSIVDIVKKINLGEDFKGSLDSTLNYNYKIFAELSRLWQSEQQQLNRY